MAYFCTNFVIIMQLSFVRQGWCFATYFPKFFLKSFQRSFENAHLPNILLGRPFQEDLPNKFQKCGSFPRKRNLPKIFLRSFENVAPDFLGLKNSCVSSCRLSLKKPAFLKCLSESRKYFLQLLVCFQSCMGKSCLHLVVYAAVS